MTYELDNETSASWIKEGDSQKVRKMLLRAAKGGPGSGNWGHTGRPGKRGGSASGSGGLGSSRGLTARAKRSPKGVGLSKRHKDMNPTDLLKEAKRVEKTLSEHEDKAFRSGHSRRAEALGVQKRQIEGELDKLANAEFNARQSMPHIPKAIATLLEKASVIESQRVEAERLGGQDLTASYALRDLSNALRDLASDKFRKTTVNKEKAADKERDSQGRLPGDVIPHIPKWQEETHLSSPDMNKAREFLSKQPKATIEKMRSTLQGTMDKAQAELDKMKERQYDLIRSGIDTRGDVYQKLLEKEVPYRDELYRAGFQFELLRDY